MVDIELTWPSRDYGIVYNSSRCYLSFPFLFFSFRSSFIDNPIVQVYNGTSPVIVMSRWNTRQMNSAEFCQLDRLLASCGKLRQAPAKLWQVLAKCGLLEDCIYVCARAYASTTKTPDYLVMRFPRYSFLFFTQRLILSARAIPIDLDRIYIVPSNLLRSLFAPLQGCTPPSCHAYASIDWVRNIDKALITPFS